MVKSGETLLFFIGSSGTLFLGAVVETKDAPTLRGLYPSSSSHKQGYVKVSELHAIYYEVFGNPKGRPAVCELAHCQSKGLQQSWANIGRTWMILG